MSPAVLVAVVGSVLLCLGLGLLTHAPHWSRALEKADREAMQALGGALRVLMGLALVYGALRSGRMRGQERRQLDLNTRRAQAKEDPQK